MAQLVEHILGKDEVPSSNLGSSSKKALHTKCFFVFYMKFTSDLRVAFLFGVRSACDLPAKADLFVKRVLRAKRCNPCARFIGIGIKILKRN